ncbi:MAG: hypothetical protein ACJ72S_10845 [Nitrososphaeraceae archaeon]
MTTIASMAVQSEAQLLVGLQEKPVNNNIAFALLDSFEYTFDISGAQIFPNDTIKNSIVTDYRPSVYNISSLQYEILGHTINASDVQIHVEPTRIDDINTRLDFQIYANSAQVTGELLSKSYNNLEITSTYGIYNRATDNMTIHVPYSAALTIIGQ